MSFLRQFTHTIRGRFLGSYLLVALLVFGLEMVSFWQLSQVQRLSAQIPPASLQLEILQQYAIALSTFDAELERLFVLNSAQEADLVRQRLSTLDAILIELQANTQGIETEVQQLIRINDELQSQTSRLLEINQANGSAQQVTQEIVAVFGSLEQLQTIYQNLTVENSADLRATASEQNDLIVGLLPLYLVFGGLVFIISVAGGWFVNRGLIRPLVTLTDTAQQIQQGDLSKQVPLTNLREIDQLAVTFNGMTNQLRITLAKLEEQLQERKKTIVKLREVDQAKSQFITMISHELRTPLNAINGFSEMMSLGMSGDLPPQAQADIDLIHKNGLHLTQLVNDILDLSQVESGKLQIETEAIPIEPVVADLLPEVSLLQQEKPIEIVTDIPPDLPAIQADRTRFRQILLNLLSNAIKFTDQGTVTVRASVAATDRIRVAIIDTGIGISLDNQQRIFEDFQQVDMTDARKYGGTGLGLSICHQLVQLHGGQLGVKSEVGAGSEFWFTMPMVQNETNNDSDEKAV